MQVALTVAGSDPAGGAGIQGDLRTFAACDVHGLSAITAIIAQGTRGVRHVWPVDAARVRAQIEVVLSDVAAHAMKTGALINAQITRAVVEALPPIPLVVDPVIASSSGATLLDDLGPLRDELMPRATLITPNVRELRLLLGDSVDASSVDDLIRGAERLRAMGARAVLAKGGHLAGDPIDVLVDDSGVTTFTGARIVTTCTRGTGCTLSAAVAAHLARGATLLDAVTHARALLRAGLESGVPIGEGESPLGIR
jgi:hydroxymethylpyrimidine kinase/phosphomethylpyrimidine kinase